MSTFTANHLIALAAVGRTGSLTAASAALGKTQPAVSAHLKQLADAVGAPLVTRHRYGVVLTPAAESLLSYAEACLRAMEGAQQAIARLQGFEEGTLRVLASPSVAVYVLPAALAAFSARFPQIVVTIARHRADEAIRALESGAGDVALVRGSPSFAAGRSSHFSVREILADETVLAVPRDHPLASHRTITPRHLKGLDIVAREPGSATRALIERSAAAAGIAFNTKFEAAGVEALKEAVLQGFGAGFISELAIRREIASGLLTGLRIPAFRLARPVTLAYPATGLSVPAVPRFVEVMDTTYPRARG